MKKIIFTIILFVFSISASLKAQLFTIENKDLIVMLKLTKNNDSIITINRILINRTNNDIYVSKHGDTAIRKQFFCESNEIPIELGTTQLGLILDVAPRLVKLKPRDTLKTEEIVNIGGLNTRDKLIIDFDYLCPFRYNKRAQKKIFKTLVIFPEVEEEQYMIFKTIYGRYCDTFTITIPNWSFINR